LPEGVEDSEGSRLIASLSMVRTEFSGPLPHPSLLAGYEQVLPGLAGRIVSMAESEQKYDLELRERALSADIADTKAGRMEARIGQVFGLIIGLAGLGAACFLALAGEGIAGATIGGATIVTLVAAFIKGRQDAKAEREAEEAKQPQPQQQSKKKRRGR
jgi:uncharacterized membrane protein